MNNKIEQEVNNLGTNLECKINNINESIAKNSCDINNLGTTVGHINNSVQILEKEIIKLKTENTMIKAKLNCELRVSGINYIVDNKLDVNDFLFKLALYLKVNISQSDFISFRVIEYKSRENEKTTDNKKKSHLEQ